MSIIKDFKDLHIGTRTSVLTILFQMPFFFIAIFLFKHNLINSISINPLIDMKFWFLISMCFCFSLTWFLMNISLTFLVIAFADKVSKTDSEPHELYIASMIYSIVYLSSAIILNYNLHYDFNHFLLYSYSFILARIVCVILWTFILRKHL